MSWLYIVVVLSLAQIACKASNKSDADPNAVAIGNAKLRIKDCDGVKIVAQEKGDMIVASLPDEYDRSYAKIRYKTSNGLKVYNWEVPFTAKTKEINVRAFSIVEQGKTWVVGQEIEELSFCKNITTTYNDTSWYPLAKATIKTDQGGTFEYKTDSRYGKAVIIPCFGSGCSSKADTRIYEIDLRLYRY